MVSNKTAARAALINNIEQARALSLENVPSRTEPASILMCDPEYFEIKDTKNPFMEGNIASTDRGMARRQWEDLKACFERFGYLVKVISPQPDFEDMVFTANQVLPGVDDEGNRYVLLGEMSHESRRREVPFYAKWFESQGYRILRLSGGGSEASRFEGQGDAVWHPGKRLLWGGFGHRTAEPAYDQISNLLDIPIVKLRLVNPKFYHLDTAFCVLDQKSVMYYPPAFDDDGTRLIEHYFPQRVTVSEADALNFACNALTLGKQVVLQQGSEYTCAKLRNLGFTPVEVETAEFMKSGGSVFCLKMMIY